MHRTGAYLLAAASLAGCNTEPPAPGVASGPAPRCIPVERIVGRYAGGANSIIFEMSGGTSYRNVLPSRCPGLETAGKTDTIAIEPTGNQLCTGDTVKVFDPIEARGGGTGAFPECRLGEFAPVTNR